MNIEQFELTNLLGAVAQQSLEEQSSIYDLCDKISALCQGDGSKRAFTHGTVAMSIVAAHMSLEKSYKRPENTYLPTVINLNGVFVKVSQPFLSYEDLMGMIGKPADAVVSVTWSTKNASGSLLPGQTVNTSDKLIVSAMVTGNA